MATNVLSRLARIPKKYGLLIALCVLIASGVGVLIADKRTPTNPQPGVYVSGTFKNVKLATPYTYAFTAVLPSDYTSKYVLVSIASPAADRNSPLATGSYHKMPIVNHSWHASYTLSFDNIQGFQQFFVIIVRPINYAAEPKGSTTATSFNGYYKVFTATPDESQNVSPAVNTSNTATTSQPVKGEPSSDTVQ